MKKTFQELEQDAITLAEITTLSQDLFKYGVTLFHERSIEYNEGIRLQACLLACTKIFISFSEYLIKDAKIDKDEVKWILNSGLVTLSHNLNKLVENHPDLYDKNPKTKLIKEADFLN